MGSAAFSIPSLDALIKSSHRVIGVMTNREKPAGRGLETRPTPVAELANRHGIDTMTPVTLRDNSEVSVWIRGHAPDAIVVVAYGKFIPPGILSMPVHGCLNLHPSLLPRYRGAAPIQRALMNGDEKTGVTVMLLDEGMDSGPIYMQEEVSIGPTDNATTLGERLSRTGAEVLLTTLSLIDQKRIEPVAQRHELATFAPKINREEGKLDFARPSMELCNAVRGLVEWPTAWTMYRGSVVQVLDTEYVVGENAGPPGTIVKIDKVGIHVATGDGTLVIRSVRPAGGRSMDALSYANGKRIKTGEIFRAK